MSVPKAAQSADSGADVRLAELIMALSLATDLGMGMPMEWALRSCLLSVHLGEALGLSEQALAAVYYLALLRFVGCTSNAHQDAALYGDELAVGPAFAVLDHGNPAQMMGLLLRHVGAHQPALQRARTVAGLLAGGPQAVTEEIVGHCEVAQRLAARLGFSPPVEQALGQMYERWDGQGLPRHLKGEALALPVRIIQLAQDAETFHRLSGVEGAVSVVRRRAGGAYDPAIAERFCRDAPRLCGLLPAESVWEAALIAEPGPRPGLSEAELDNAAQALADFTDLKSPYTIGHSSGVAALAAAAAQICGLAATEVVAVRRAGWLHDLGRVGVSAGIWGKPGPLTDSEWERVRLHPYYTERILARPRALARLGALAALHHERMDGSGYHRGIPAVMQPPAARILAAADAYHAMTEPRPHRLALSPEQAADELRRDLRAGWLDSEAVNAILTVAGHAAPAARRERAAGLSDREVEVLRLIARGFTNRQVAQALIISEKTVGHHVQHIYDKIDVSSRAGATLFAMQHNLLIPAA